MSEPTSKDTSAEGSGEKAEFRPYVAANAPAIEFTLKSVLAGILFGILFGAANAYLGLRVGLTISTSIPVAVLTVALFKALQAAGSKTGILEANLSQTIGSASSSVASGVIFTLPALFLWGVGSSLLQMTLLALSGGLIGVLFMIPLRRYLIVREHGKLPYPEGTACAEVLKASEAGRSQARNVFLGLGVGGLIRLLTGWLHVVKDRFDIPIPFLKKGQVGVEVSGALFGVGYILGPRVATIMVSGGLLASLIIIPALAWWGEGRVDPLFPETVLRLSEMSPGQIWSRYVRYIGAGAVATAGILTLIRSIPTMIESFRVGAAQLKRRVGNQAEEAVARTDRDLPISWVLGGVGLVVVVLALVPQAFGTIDGLLPRVVAALLVAIGAFFFVTVSSRIVGLVGVTSNPTSGMTIACLLATATVFSFMGWNDMSGRVAALCVGTVVAIAASIAGDTSQDLKTGYLLGATPARQQLGEIIGVLTSAIFVCLTVLALHKQYGLGGEVLSAPQATLMKLVIDGVLDRNLPWTLVAIGAGLAILAELFRLPSLAFAVGVYLPVATMVPLFFGGLLRWWLSRDTSEEEGKQRVERGILFGSGLVGGEGLIGVGIAMAALLTEKAPSGIGPEWAGSLAPWVAAASLLGLAWFYRRVVLR